MKKPLKKKVVFEYCAASAESVSVAGTFNDWDDHRHVLKRKGEGLWQLTLQLEPGLYEYRYFVDGVWQNDQRPVECIPNAFGTWNCVLKVE
ncbi:MAG: isoamylase early set domain-containing protein [Candidatus Omnitrophica bacterium]|nr:isoamylase early set domain-containing protein [Candidatus Omnitrophota bacterium]